ncbi:MAG: polyprenyl synthetase family protein [Acidobacteriia bacterium]|nr:polyprenyl synthetase family protein [Terriglobia bacterium]
MQTPAFILERSRQIEEALDRLLPSNETIPQSIHRAMRYSVFAGGKRLRPTLCLEAAAAVGASEGEVIPVACAVEMIHTYSLIHDDLPALDNDDLRRGRPTVHKQFGEAVAILAGDALLTRAFQVLGSLDGGGEILNRRIHALREIGDAVGTVEGMIGGQVVDIESEGKEIPAELLHYIHSSKTGALIRASVRAGAFMGEAAPHELSALTEYGSKIGLAFQITDDILDVVSSAEQLGKTPGKDRSTRKATYPGLYGLDESRRKAKQLVIEAVESLDCLQARGENLKTLAYFFVERAA